MDGQMTIYDLQPSLRQIHDIPELSKEWRDKEGWTDHWHYVDEENPAEEGFYWVVTYHHYGQHEGYNHTYGLYKSGVWCLYNYTTKSWRPISFEKTICWAEMPSCYWTKDFIERSTDDVDIERNHAWWVRR